MNGRIDWKTCVVLAGSLAALAAGSEAWASGFQLREQSSEGLGTAFAGSTAKANDISTIFYNPAGMALLKGNQVGASLTWIAPVSKFRGHSTDGGTSGGDAIGDAPLPASYALFEVSPDLKFGLALTAPFGLMTDYDFNWAGRYHALKSEVKNINLTPSVAYRINDRLSIGGGVQLGYTEATMTRAVSLAPLGVDDAYFGMTGDGLAAGIDLGLIYEFSPTTRVGVNWRSQMSYTLRGNANYNTPELPWYTPPAVRAALTNAQIKADLTTPDTVSVGFYHELSPQWAVMSDIVWTKWSNFKELRIKYADGRPDAVTPENWHDTWFFSLGATYKIDDVSTLHFGVAYDQTPVDDEDRRASIPDANRLWLAAGYSRTINANTRINLSYAHLFADRAVINEVSETALHQSSLTGSYEGHVDIFSAGVALKF